MLTISRKDGTVTGSLGPEAQQAIWAALVKNLGTEIMTTMIKEVESDG